MNINELYLHNYSEEVSDYVRSRFCEGLGLMYNRFFRDKNHEKLFWILTHTPQSTENILGRQAVIKDLLEHGAEGIFGFQALLDELYREVKSDDMVKVWKNEGSGKYPRYVPLIYDYRALNKCVLRFQKICEDLVACLGKSQSSVFSGIRNHCMQFISDSDIVRKWERHRKILELSEKPFLALIEQDKWSHGIKSMQPIGVLEPESLQSTLQLIQTCLSRGIFEITLLVGDERIPLKILEVVDPRLRPKRISSNPPKRYIDYDLFSDIGLHVYSLKELIGQLSLYRSMLKMRDQLKEDGLPFCYPQVVNEAIIDIQDFYPYHEALTSKEYVMNSLRLDSQNMIALISGLNRGGKSATLETIVTNVGLTRLGGVIPAKEATIGNFSRVHQGSIVGGHASDHTSRFQAQVDSALEFLDDMQQEGLSLGLLDEALSGTDSETGKRSMCEVLKILSQVIRKPTLVVTHCTPAAYEVRDNPSDYPGIILRYFGRTKSDEPDFVMREGIGLSEGMYLAKRAGLTLEDFSRKHLSGDATKKSKK